MKPLIIQGSSRSDGNTGKITRELNSNINADILDLKRFNIQHYEYEKPDTSDDFMKAAEEMSGRNKLIFVSPIYWYTMSGLMKVFFDRLTDLIDYRNELARELENMEMYVVSCGSTPDPGKGFDLPFVQSAEYFNMKYRGYLHTWLVNGSIPEDLKLKLKQFI